MNIIRKKQDREAEEKGFQKGFQEGEEKIKQTARNLKAHGQLTEEEIANMTGLTVTAIDLRANT